MSRPASQTPAPPSMSTGELVTSNGVKVVVREVRQPPPRPPSEWPVQRGPRVVIHVPDPPAQDRDAVIRAIVAEHDAFIMGTLRGKEGLQPASAEDVRQQLLIVLCEHMEDRRPPPRHERAYLAGILRNLIRRHRRDKRHDREIDGEADPDDALSPATDPEGQAMSDEHWRKLGRYLSALSEEEADLIVAVNFEDQTIEEVAARLGRPTSTVTDQLHRAQEKIEALARASARAAEIRRCRPR